jgi:hypothetical protein
MTITINRWNLHDEHGGHPFDPLPLKESVIVARLRDAVTPFDPDSSARLLTDFPDALRILRHRLNANVLAARFFGGPERFELANEAARPCGLTLRWIPPQVSIEPPRRRPLF